MRRMPACMKLKSKLLLILVVGSLSASQTACATSSPQQRVIPLAPIVRQCQVPPLPEVLETNRDLLLYTVEILSELKMCKISLDAIQKWVDELEAK